MHDDDDMQVVYMCLGGTHALRVLNAERVGRVDPFCVNQLETRQTQGSGLFLRISECVECNMV